MMKIKKLISLLMALTLVLSMTACSSGSNNAATPAPSTTAPATSALTTAATKPASSSVAADKKGVDPSGKTDKFNVVMATGGSSGAYYIMGAAFSQLAEANGSRLKFTVSNSGASTENIYLLEDKTVNFAIVQADSPYFAQLGQREFKDDKPFEALRSVYGGHSSITHLTVRADSGINSVADLRGKTIAICPSGSPTGQFHRAYLAACGLEEGAYKETYMSYGEMGEALVNSTADAVMIFNTTPNSPIIEASASTKLKILGLTKEQQDAIVTKYPYIARATIPASAYDWLKEDTLSIGALAIIITTTDVPSDVVYDLCALIGDHYNDVKASHSAGYLWDVETAMNDLGIEIHDGAKQYYKDKGLLK